MKKILRYLKICLVPITFELTIIVSQEVGEPNNAQLIFYFTFAILSTFCFMYKDFIIQIIGVFVVVFIEGILIDNQKFILNFFNNNFNMSLSSRNTTDNFLLCVFFQIIAFIVASIIVQKKNKDIEKNDEANDL